MTTLVRWLVLLLGLGGTALGDRIVRGHEGQPDLRLDYGRSLAKEGVRHRTPLTTIERARLVARQLLRHSSVPKRAAVEQLVGIVQAQLPPSPNDRYDAFSKLAQQRDEVVPLSTYVENQIGICRERAFLLAKMLRDGGLSARVKYGVVYDRKGKEIGGHAWVETRLDGKPARVDPSIDHPVSVGIRRLPVEQRMADGRVRSVKGSRSRTWLYVPEPIETRVDFSKP